MAQLLSRLLLGVQREDPPEAYQEALQPSISSQEEQEEGSQLVEQLGPQFLRLAGRDKRGQPVVLLTGRCFDTRLLRHKAALYRFIVRTLEPVSHEPYTLLYLHSGCSYWRHSPGVRWLVGAYTRLPARYRDHLAAVRVVHPDWVLTGASWLVCPWLPGALWQKVDFVPRVEFLEADVQVGSLQLPAFVLEHDALLAAHPLLDYGLTLDREEMPLPHAALMDSTPPAAELDEQSDSESEEEGPGGSSG